MAEYTNPSAQTVISGANVLFTNTPVSSGKCIKHRDGSGLVTLRGLTNGQSNARFLVTFSGNIAIPTGGAVSEISLALAINGEELSSAMMRVTPAATANYFNVSTASNIEVPAGCCQNISIENTSGQSILVDNANLIVTRVA